MKKFTLILLFCTFFIFQAKAHVTITSSHAGKTYLPGEVVSVVWQMSINHDSQNWDLYFSSDGGATWSEIQIDIPIGTLSHQWTVPETITSQAILKVVQDNPAENYEDVSEIFSISNTVTGINETNTAIKITVYPNPVSNYATFEFDNVEHENHSLTLLNLQGQVVQTINNITDEKVILQTENLKSGLYFFKLHKEMELRSTGKLIVK